LPLLENIQKSETKSPLAKESIGYRSPESNPYQTAAEETSDTSREEPYQCLEIKDSLQFLLMFNDDLRLGKIIDGKPLSLHPWQVECNKDISYGRTRVDGEVISERYPTSLHPYKFALCAANGSGKDAFVIAPLALWFICCKIQAKVIITSASTGQLSTQTERYIKELAISVNLWAAKYFGREIIKINRRNYTCTLSGSTIYLFATDEEEKAEGHHPTVPGAEMMLIVNEAKSVPPEIFEALRRCTGYNYWLDVSSPGEPMGPFFTHYEKWPNKRRVSYFDCPHHSKEEFEEDLKEYGEHSQYFRSKWLALFTFIGGRYVVSHEKLEKLRKANLAGEVKEILQDEPIRVGIDIALSANGDETVVAMWRGNKQIGQKTFKHQDSIALVEMINKYLEEKNIKKSHKYIFADDGGVGRSVIDILNRKGYRISRVLNNSSSKNKKAFKNKGAQTWFKFGRLIEEQVLIFNDLKDEKLFKQIAARKYKQTDEGIDRMTLQSKADMRSEGYPSPDRADANVLAFTDIDVREFLDAKDTALQPPAPELVGEDIEDILRSFKGRYKGMFDKQEKSKRVYLSQQAALN
jgi:hypothetical protein